jgi:hypothetical protein
MKDEVAVANSTPFRPMENTMDPPQSKLLASKANSSAQASSNKENVEMVNDDLSSSI